jgi:hypothetical protein
MQLICCCFVIVEELMAIDTMPLKKNYKQVAKYIGIRIVVVHYPPYCSKWNPIEHRLFSQMHRQASGCIFHSYEQVKAIFQATSTETGLKVFVRINPKNYQIKLGIKKEEVDPKRILVHPTTAPI